MENSTYSGSCFCGSVQFSVSGEPAAMGYCHCESCRTWSAGPVNAFTLWKPKAVKVTRGADNIGTCKKTPNSFRKWCKTCGGQSSPNTRVGSRRRLRGDIPGLSVQAGVHVNYQETGLPIKDGCRNQGIPAEMGGSGANVPSDGRRRRAAARAYRRSPR